MDGGHNLGRRPSRRLNLEDAVIIWHLHWQGELQSRIAAKLDVNQGRVCEVLKGHRFPQAREEAERRLID